MVTLDIILKNFNDGYGDLSNHLTMFFWQQFYSIINSKDLQIRLVVESAGVSVFNNQITIEEVNKFIINFYGDYSKLLSAAADTIDKESLSEVNFSQFKAPVVIDEKDIIEQPDFVFCGPAISEIPNYVDIERVKKIFFYSEYDMMTFLEIKDRISNHIKKYPNKIEIIECGINQNRSPLITPLPGLQLEVASNIIDKLDDTLYSKKVFIYARLNSSMIEEVLLNLADGLPEKSNILLILAKKETDKFVSYFKDVVDKVMIDTGVSFTIEYTGFIPNPVFNHILAHKSLDAALLTGDQSTAAFIYSNRFPSSLNKMLYYQAEIHKLEFAKGLSSLDNVEIINSKLNLNLPWNISGVARGILFLNLKPPITCPFGFEIRMSAKILKDLPIIPRYDSSTSISRQDDILYSSKPSNSAEIPKQSLASYLWYMFTYPFVLIINFIYKKLYYTQHLKTTKDSLHKESLATNQPLQKEQLLKYFAPLGYEYVNELIELFDKINIKLSEDEKKQFSSMINDILNNDVSENKDEKQLKQKALLALDEAAHIMELRKKVLPGYNVFRISTQNKDDMKPLKKLIRRLKDKIR